MTITSGHAAAGERWVQGERNLPRVVQRQDNDHALLDMEDLLGIEDMNAIAGRPIVGASWEGFVIENLLAVAPPRTTAGFYRTAAGAEIDLILELPGKSGLWAIEIKRGLTAAPSKGFHIARDDLEPARSFIVYSGDDRYPISEDVEAIGLREMASLLAGLSESKQDR